MIFGSIKLTDWQSRWGTPCIVCHKSNLQRVDGHHLCSAFVLWSFYIINRFCLFVYISGYIISNCQYLAFLTYKSSFILFRLVFLFWVWINILLLGTGPLATDIFSFFRLTWATSLETDPVLWAFRGQAHLGIP